MGRDSAVASSELAPLEALVVPFVIVNTVSVSPASNGARVFGHRFYLSKVPSNKRGLRGVLGKFPYPFNSDLKRLLRDHQG
jgi:hypothetical protein